MISKSPWLKMLSRAIPTDVGRDRISKHLNAFVTVLLNENAIRLLNGTKFCGNIDNRQKQFSLE